MRILTSVVALSVLGCGLLAQDPPKSQPPVQQVGGKQDPKGQSTKPQDPKPQDPKGKDPKSKESKGQVPSKPQQPAGKGEGSAPAGGKAESDPPAKLPIPAGTDPADIAAMKSAEKMLEAERKLARLVKDGKIEGLDRILSFDLLTSWPYEEALRGMPEKVRKLSGQKVLMTGFMLPIDEVQNIKEFLLVKSLWACCYGQPPDIHGIVRCVMPEKKRTDYHFEPLKIIGTFKVEATMLDGYCVDIFQLHVEEIEPIK